MKYLAQIARSLGLTPTAGTPRVSAWTCAGIRQHLMFDEENMDSKSCPGMVGRAAPAAILFCPEAIRTSFFFCYSLQEFPLAGLPLVLSASQTFPPWHHPSAFTCFLGRSSPQNTLPLPSSFPFPCFQLLPRAKAAESLSKHTRDMKCLLSALFSPEGICKETRISTENNSSQTAGLVFF